MSRPKAIDRLTVAQKLTDALNLRMKVRIMCDTEEELLTMLGMWEKMGSPKRVTIVPTPPKRKGT